MSQPTITNPYIGPRTFEESDREFFFGREREARELLSLVIAEPLVLLYAQSGTGKSSLINTLLIPRLRDEDFHILPKCRVGEQPLKHQIEVSNIFVFNLLLTLDQNKTTLADLANLSLTDYLQAHKYQLFMSEYYDKDNYYELRDDENLPPRQSVTIEAEVDEEEYEEVEPPIRALIIDQFEEIFTHYPERWPDQQGFFQQLHQAMADDPYLWVIISLREDFLAYLDPYATLFPGKLRARFRLELLGYEAALQAIQKPAIQAGIPFAAGVAENMVDNLRRIQPSSNLPRKDSQPVLGAYIEPVHLQLVCRQLWTNLPPDCPQIEAQHVQQFGDVDQALISFYEATIQDVITKTNVSERSLRTWVSSQLITPGRTRGLVYRGKYDTVGLPNEAINILHQAYIIHAEVRGANMWYELTHDRLVEPILTSNDAWEHRTRRPLAIAASAWLAHNRNPNKLYRGELLREAKQLAKMKPDELSELEKSFIIASLEDGRRRINQRMRYTLLGAIGIIIMLSALTIYGNIQAMNARNNHNLAVTAEHIAIAQKATAEKASTEANMQRVTAIAAERLAENQVQQLSTAQAEANVQRGMAQTASLDAISQKETAQAASYEAICQKETAEAERQSAVYARETLVHSLENMLTAQAHPTNTAIPTSTATPTPLQMAAANPKPMASTTATPNYQTTATVAAVQKQLEAIRATQTVAALNVSMAAVPAGQFQMGFIPNTDRLSGLTMSPDLDEQPAHLVQLPTYWIDRAEVSNGEYQECVKANVCHPPVGGDPLYHTDSEYKSYPVNFVAWHDAQSYCDWVGKRLPTEAEWEKAARGPDGRVWSWGNVLKDDPTHPFVEKANVRDGTHEGPVEVLTYSNGGSPYHVLNLIGNVSEWVNDWYSPTYYSQRPNPDNSPQGPLENESNGFKVIRGGSFLDLVVDSRADERNALSPDTRAINVGFRCAR